MMPSKGSLRVDLYNEIDECLETKVMTSDQLLNEFIVSMTTQELYENWEHVKRIWSLEPDPKENTNSRRSLR